MSRILKILPYERKKIYNKMAKYNPYGYKVNLIINNGNFYCSDEDKIREIRELKKKCSSMKLYPDIISWYLNHDYAFKAYSDAIQWTIEQKERVILVVDTFNNFPYDLDLLKQIYNLFKSGKAILFSLEEKVSLNPKYGINSDGFEFFQKCYSRRFSSQYWDGKTRDYNLSYYF